MHSAVAHLALVLAAEKSKVPFYVAGGVLVLWALFISLAVGMRRPDFPANLGQQRGVMAVTVVLVLAAVSTAVVTAGGKKAAAATPAEQTSNQAVTGSGGTGTSQTTGATPAPTTATPTQTGATPAPPGAKTSLTLTADPSGQLSYDTKQLSAKAGAVTITMTNMSPLEHNVTIAQGSAVLGSTPTFKGASKSVTLDLRPGSYTFYCSVPGHRAAGMEGTLTVS